MQLLVAYQSDAAGSNMATFISKNMTKDGNVYRGKEIPDFNGHYIFGIFSSKAGTPDAKIFIAKRNESGLWPFDDIILKNYPNNLGQYLKGFGQDLDGEIYIATSGQQGPSGTTGKIYKLAMVSKK